MVLAKSIYECFFFFSFLIFIIVLLPCYIPLVGNTNSGRSLAGTLNSYGLRQPINSHGSAVPRLQRPGRDAGYAWKISCFFFLRVHLVSVLHGHGVQNPDMAVEI